MSHFTVLVIGQKPEEQLAPYQENNMGDCPKEFLKYRVLDKDGDDHWFDSEEAFKASGIETDGDEGYWDNPNKKWDWFLLGGRWTGYFKTKLGVVATVGEAGIMTDEAPVGYADQLTKGEVDFEAMRKEAAIEAEQKYDYAAGIFGDLLPNETWEDVRKRVSPIDEARNVYWAQDRCKAWTDKRSKNSKTWPFGFNTSPDEFLITKEEYVQKARNSAITTHAMIYEGKWYERGEMGWFAVVKNEKEGEQWDREFTALLDGLPDDTLLSLYDCHI